MVFSMCLRCLCYGVYGDNLICRVVESQRVFPIFHWNWLKRSWNIKLNSIIKCVQNVKNVNFMSGWNRKSTSDRNGKKLSGKFDFNS